MSSRLQNTGSLLRSVVVIAGVLVVAGLSATPALPQPAAALTEAEARLLIGPLYAALNAPSVETMESLLESATAETWRDCADNDQCDDRPTAIQHLRQRLATVPGIQVEIKEVIAAGDRIIVRGEERGTPVAPFLGIKPSGRSFQVMTIDIHDVSKGKIAGTRHIENWALAIRQLSPATPSRSPRLADEPSRTSRRRISGSTMARYS